MRIVVLTGVATLALATVTMPAATAMARDSRIAQSPPAQSTPPPVPTARGRGGRANAPQRPMPADPAHMQTVQEIFDALELSEADKFLQLNEEQYSAFVLRLRRYQDMRRQQFRQRLRLVAALRQVTNQQPPVEDALLEAPTRQLDDFDRQAAIDLLTARGKLDEVLNLRQRARLRLFQEVMERRKLEIVARVMRQ
jgi:hypothetical protein